MRKDLCWQFYGKVWDKLGLTVYFVLTVNLLNLTTFNISSLCLFHAFFFSSSPYSFPTVLRNTMNDPICKPLNTQGCIRQRPFPLHLLLLFLISDNILSPILFSYTQPYSENSSFYFSPWFLSNSPYSLLGVPIHNLWDSIFFFFLTTLTDSDSLLSNSLNVWNLHLALPLL